MEEQFGVGFRRFEEQIRILSDQLAAMGGPNDRHHQPNPRHADDEYSIGSEPFNPSARRGVRREYPMAQAHANQWEARFKLDIPEFKVVYSLRSSRS